MPIFERVRIINETTIEVNLDAPSNMPFNFGDGCKIESQKGSGWVRIEKRPSGLYVDGRRVILYLSEDQIEGSIDSFHALRRELSNKPVLHPNILDALFDNPHLIPENWKEKEEDWEKEEDEEKRYPLYISFWGVIFYDPNGHLCVRILYFDDGRWHRYCDWLGYRFNSRHRACVLEER